MSFRGTFYTTQRLHGAKDKGNTGVLEPDQDGINTLGQAYVQIGNPEKFAAQLYRNELQLPYINRYDVRMIPITHEAYLAGRYGTGRDVIFGHIRQQKDWDTDQFVSLSVIAGAGDTHKGVSVLGAKWTSNNGLELGAITEHGWDLFNTTYAEASWRRKLNDNWSANGGLQFTDQRSVGDELLGSYDTQHWGVNVDVGYRNAIASLAYTEYSDDAELQSPFGSTPSFNSMIVADFDRAGERSTRIGLSYNLSRLGLPAWSGFSNVVFGSNAEDPVLGVSLNDRREYDFTLDYKPTSGPLRGLWARLRYAYVDTRDEGHLTDFRIVVNYDLPTL